MWSIGRIILTDENWGTRRKIVWNCEFYRTFERKGMGGGFCIESPFLIWFYHGCHFLLLSFLGACAELRKTTLSFVMSVCPCDRPHGTVRLPLDALCAAHNAKSEAQPQEWRHVHAHTPTIGSSQTEHKDYHKENRIESTHVSTDF